MLGNHADIATTIEGYDFRREDVIVITDEEDIVDVYAGNYSTAREPTADNIVRPECFVFWMQLNSGRLAAADDPSY